MSISIWHKAKVSSCETFHHFNEVPLYPHRFDKVLKYHAPGLAPVRDATGAFHIDLMGFPAYVNRFIETFGFYEGMAAVKAKEGWFHITQDGIEAYKSRYLWCGNYQEALCPVRDNTGLYFHLDQKGQNAYKERYSYVGDFKDGFAVVCNSEGLHTHIDPIGEKLHDRWFIDLDIFHKGFARAKDEKGWFHIDKAGNALYSERYTNIEPFYNGISRVETHTGALLTINPEGKTIAELRQGLHNSWHQLSDDMVGFWRTETIATAIHLKIFDYLPGSLSTIAYHSRLPESHLERVLRALWELDLVVLQNQHWELTSKGMLLSPQSEQFLVAAATMWSDINSPIWKKLSERIQTGFNTYHSAFKAWAVDEKLQIYHRAIDGYAKMDADLFLNAISWQGHKKVIGVERNSKVLLEKLLEREPHLQAKLLGEEYIIKHANIIDSLTSRYSLKAYDIRNPWSEIADAIVLPKILHFWPDQDVLKILINARQALSTDGKIYVFEILLSKESPSGSLLDLNILVETGGQLRFIEHWEKLFSEANLTIIESKYIVSGVYLLVLGPSNKC